MTSTIATFKVGSFRNVVTHVLKMILEFNPPSPYFQHSKIELLKISFEHKNHFNKRILTISQLPLQLRILHILVYQLVELCVFEPSLFKLRTIKSSTLNETCTCHLAGVKTLTEDQPARTAPTRLRTFVSLGNS